MSVGSPWGLLGLTALVPLLAAYFLRRRHRPVRVSALFLWRTPNLRGESGARFRRFSRELSLLLEALAVIAATAFLANVGCGGRTVQRHLVAVVDGSLSMSARRDGKTVAERVRRALAHEARLLKAQEVTVVESGATPKVLVGPDAPAAKGLSALRSWRPLEGAHGLASAVTLARDLAGPGQKVFVYTDAMPPDVSHWPPEVEVVALGAPLPNVAVVSAQREDRDGVAHLRLRVANDSAHAARVKVRAHAVLLGGGAPVERSTVLRLPAGGNALWSLTLSAAGPVTFSLPPDALPEDGTVTLPPEPVRRVRVGLLSGLDAAARSAVERFLAVDPGVTTEGTPTLRIGPRGSKAELTLGAPGKERTFVGPFFADRSSPLLEDVHLGGVVWTVGKNPPGRPLVSADDAVLVSEEPDGRVDLNLDLSRSNVQRTPAWPVLLANVVRLARAGLPGFVRHQVPVGQGVPVVLGDEGGYALLGPDGPRPLFGAGRVLLAPFRVPGRYRLMHAKAAVDALEVLAIAPSESDLRKRGSGTRKASGKSSTSSHAPHRAAWPLLALLGLTMGAFAITARGGRA